MKKNLNSRRSFIKMAGGAALSSTTFSSFPIINLQPQKSLRIGIIGGSVSAHTFDYGKLFNIDKKFPGVELMYAWADTEEFAIAAREKAAIPNIVKDPNEMIGKIDALIINHRDGKYHFKPAIPFIKAKIPTFIDKAFTNSVVEARELLSLARSAGTPVSSWSTIAQSDKNLDLKKQVESMSPVNNFVIFGPVDIESPYGGVFFYGVHFVDQLLYIFGDNVSKVRITRNGKNTTASLLFNTGMLATIIFMTVSWNNILFAESKKGLVELKSNVQEKDPPRYYSDMVDMFLTGREPRSHDSIIYSISVLEALEKSIKSDGWEEVRV